MRSRITLKSLGYESRRIHLTLAPDEWHTIERMADETYDSTAAIIRQILSAAIVQYHIDERSAARQDGAAMPTVEIAPNLYISPEMW